MELNQYVIANEQMKSQNYKPPYQMKFLQTPVLFELIKYNLSPIFELLALFNEEEVDW